MGVKAKEIIKGKVPDFFKMVKEVGTLSQTRR